MKEPKVLVTWRGPRERMVEVGSRALSDEELVAILLGTGHGSESVTELSARLLREVGGLAALVNVGVGGLAKISGIGPAKATRIVAALELGKRAAVPPLERRKALRTSEEVFAIYGPKLQGLPNEHFIAIPLDARGRPMGELLIGEGEPASCFVSPGEVFRRLLREAAVSAIFVHNHPSGDPEPSEADMELTHRLFVAGEILGIRILDHLVIGHGRYFSFLDSGCLNETIS